MTNIEILSLIVAWRALLVNNAFLISTLLFLVLLLVTYQLVRARKFISIIIFIVYVGGIIILISYCVILIPDRKFSYANHGVVLFIVLLSVLAFNVSPTGLDSYSFGLINSCGAILLLGLLLYIVMLVVVDVIDYSRGIIIT